MDAPRAVDLVAQTKPDRWRRAVHFIKGRSLAECVDGGRDNILMLRLLAAVMVVFGHSYAIYAAKWVAFEPLHRILPQTYTSLVGVMLFFMISGFLITLSYQRRPDLLRFIRARVLRIWPAYFVCGFVWAIVFGPIITDRSLADYFSFEGRTTPYRYVWSTMTIFWPYQLLPGVFLRNPVPGAINVSVWTIPYEATMYLWVAGAGVLGLLRFPRLTSIAIAALGAVCIGWPMLTGKLPNVFWFGLVLQGFFGAGAIACLLRRYIPISTGLMIAIAVACLVMRHSIHATPFLWLAVGYFALWFAYVPRLPSIPWDLDVSYGVYLWAYPLKQCLVQFAGISNPLILFVTVLPPVLVFATGSWLFIEKPALKLKDWRWRRAPAMQTA